MYKQMEVKMCIPNLIGWAMASVILGLFVWFCYWGSEYDWKKTLLIISLFVGILGIIGFFVVAVKLIQYQC